MSPVERAVDEFIEAVPDEQRRDDARTLCELMTDLTGEPATIWGSGIVGFGRYHYRYASGHEGDSCLAGFASRKGELTLYLTSEPMERGELMRKLGKHREGKGCVYLKNLDGIDLEVLGELVKLSAETIRRKYPDEA